MTYRACSNSSNELALPHDPFWGAVAPLDPVRREARQAGEDRRDLENAVDAVTGDDILERVRCAYGDGLDPHKIASPEPRFAHHLDSLP
jgi:hypothetical protein